MSEPERPLRADARRNRERIVAAAGELFAARGQAVQMEEVAVRAGLGMGTLYRHFPNKQALLTAMVCDRFEGMAALAHDAEEIADPGTAFEAVLRGYLEAAEGDAGFQLALMSSSELGGSGLERLEREKAKFATVLKPIIERAVAAGAVRADLTVADFPVLTVALMSTMYFKPGGNADWRRHLEIVLDGLRPRA